MGQRDQRQKFIGPMSLRTMMLDITPYMDEWYTDEWNVRWGVGGHVSSLIIQIKRRQAKSREYRKIKTHQCIIVSLRLLFLFTA